MTGWRRLITATVRLAHRDGTRLERRPADGRLLFEPVGETTSRSAERVRGIVTGTWALSAEICQACGGPGDPVTLGRSGRGTRCGDCREPGDRLLARPAWRQERETLDEAPGLLEDVVGARDLADLMEARHTPATHASWPVRRSQGDPYMTIVCPIDGAGWNHLLRAGLAVLLPLECPGVAPPLASRTDQGAARQAEDPPPPPHAVLRGDRRHPERRQRDDVHLLRPSRPHAETGLDAPSVRPMLDSRTA